MIILAIESSCDDTSAAIIESSISRSNIISSQNFHTKYGGIVPELASRAHIQIIDHVTNTALKDAGVEISQVDAIAVTSEPGLIGSLIVGANYAKAISIKYNLPIVPVNHIEGHIYSGSLEDKELEFPYICLVVSGGHTVIFDVRSYNDYDIVGLTKDDAAGEAFDKIAKLLNMGYPGGPLIDKRAKEGNEKAYDFPRSMIHSKDYDFSFSGLKTSVRYFIRREFPEGVPEEKIPDVAASAQAAIVDVLVDKTVRAAIEFGAKSIVIAGGVSANSSLRMKMFRKAEESGIKTVAPGMQYCMDNAAMIGFIAEQKILEAGKDKFYDLEFRVNPTALRRRRA